MDDENNFLSIVSKNQNFLRKKNRGNDYFYIDINAQRLQLFLQTYVKLLVLKSRKNRREYIIKTQNEIIKSKAFLDEPLSSLYLHVMNVLNIGLTPEDLFTYLTTFEGDECKIVTFGEH